MWEHPATQRHLHQITDDLGHSRRLIVVSPISKRLACDDVGMGAMAPVEEIVASVSAALRLSVASEPEA
jgi:phosphopantothenoylcysteine decarboxylase